MDKIKAIRGWLQNHQYEVTIVVTAINVMIFVIYLLRWK